jgi:hypothetical protein
VGHQERGAAHKQAPRRQLQRLALPEQVEQHRAIEKCRLAEGESVIKCQYSSERAQ